MVDTDDAYHVPAFYSSKDQRTEGGASILAEDAPVKISVTACRSRSVRDGISITFDNEAADTISSLAMSDADTLRLIEKIAEVVSWKLK